MCLDDYSEWFQRLYVYLQTKFFELLCGPMWTKDPTNQDRASKHLEGLTLSRTGLKLIN